MKTQPSLSKSQTAEEADAATLSEAASCSSTQTSKIASVPDMDFVLFDPRTDDFQTFKFSA
ncbi:hypothetical protein SAMN03159406_00544 [Rhizobium sp. NFR03]|nr:hypothetical protein SAMN03159406_00544 [Rhizobium sp. NFR03]